MKPTVIRTLEKPPIGRWSELDRHIRRHRPNHFDLPSTAEAVHLDWALAYARLGWHDHPCRPGEKARGVSGLQKPTFGELAPCLADYRNRGCARYRRPRPTHGDLTP